MNQVRPSVDRAEKGPATKSDLIGTTHTRQKVGRLCGDTEKFQKHIDLVESSNNKKTCKVCDLDFYTTCGLYKRAPVHFFPQKGRQQKSKTCFAEYHSDIFLA